LKLSKTEDRRGREKMCNLMNPSIQLNRFYTNVQLMMMMINLVY